MRVVVTVTVEGGTIRKPNADQSIATLSGADVLRSGADVLTVRLDETQMDALSR